MMSIQAQIIERIGAKWGLDPDPILIRHTQNAVFSARADGAEVIVRVSDSRHRTREMLLAEFEWMAFLAERGVAVCAPIASRAGNLLESIADVDGTQFAAVFPKAQGRAVEGIGEIDRALAVRWGRTLGLMNRVSRDFRPSAGLRSHGDGEGIHSLGRYVRRMKDPPSRLESLVDWIGSLPKDDDSYGLIHSDFQPSNFFYDDEGLYPFDFDDCCYHWRVADLGYSLYSLYFDLKTGSGDLRPFERIREDLVAGFVGEFPAIEKSLAHLDRFILYRVGLLYCWCRDRDTAPRWMQEVDAEWLRLLLDWSAAEIEGGFSLGAE